VGFLKIKQRQNPQAEACATNGPNDDLTLRTVSIPRASHFCYNRAAANTSHVQEEFRGNASKRFLARAVAKKKISICGIW